MPKELEKLVPKSFMDVIKKKSIKTLRPAQKKSIKAGVFEGQNILVCTPTASGKTLCAVFAMIQAFNDNKKSVYSVPLKALASEKFLEIKEYLEPLGAKVVKSVGDLDSEGESLSKADVVVCSNEKLDSLIRHNVSWLKDVRCLVVDEVHLLNDVSRGPTLEILITMFRQLVKPLHIIALSATVKNSADLADWLDAALVRDDWRPAKLYHGVLSEGVIDFFDSKEDLSIKQLSDDMTTDLALDTINANKQALIFVGTKRSAYAQAKRIASKVKLSKEEQDFFLEVSAKAKRVVSPPTSQCEELANVLRKGVAFHHSGLHPRQRKIIEELFRDKKLKIICSTPTLAMGVDLPAFRSIVRDLKRYSTYGMDWIPVLEAHQMFGRGGRPNYDIFGEAICIAQNEAEKNRIYTQYICGEPEPILSKIAVEPVLRTYLLSLISIDFINSRSEILDFFSKTFWAFHYGDMRDLERIINRMLALLVDFDFIKMEGRARFQATALGKRVATLYLDPVTADFLIQGLKRSDSVDVSEFSFLQLIARAPEIGPLPSLRKVDTHEEMLAGVEDELLDTEVFEEGFFQSVKAAFVFSSWIDELSERDILDRFGATPGMLHSLKTNANWLLYSLRELSKLTSSGDPLFIEMVRHRMRYGVKRELLPLVRLKGVGRVRARRLFRAGFKSSGALKMADITTLSQAVGRATAVSIKKQLGIRRDYENPLSPKA